MKSLFLLVLLPTISLSNTVRSGFGYSLKELINSNISEFNKMTDGCDKEETFFEKVSKDFVVTNEGKNIGHLLVFDDNQGYITISNENVILDHNYSRGLDNIEFCTDSFLEFDGVSYSSSDDKVVHQKVNPNAYAGTIENDFYWHADSSFYVPKTRYLEQDLDPSYSTPTSTIDATFHNKTTWSTYQGSDPDCGPLALANLLWTYKLNGVVDLTMGATSSSSLAYSLRSYLNYNSTYGVIFTDMLYGDDYFSSTGYYLDYTNIANGISDTLSTTPIIGAYSHVDGHFALITGKGKSVYKVILGIKFYTYWDITNTWHDRTDKVNGYYCCKYWVDNQYLAYGFVLKDPNGNVVPLVNS